MDALKIQRPQTLMIPLNYTEAVHQSVIGDVINYVQRGFLGGEMNALDKKLWAKEYLTAFAEELTVLAAMIKHPKFAPEHERRLATQLAAGEHSSVISTGRCFLGISLSAWQ
jgi:hypothetical protein